MRTSNKTSKRGFTMAELLIVVAIIAVLVAVAIPVINNNLEKSREAYDIATMRQAASAAIDLYYAGVCDSSSAAANGLSWWGTVGASNSNAYGAYDPRGKFLKDKKLITAYGKGTAVDGGTKYEMNGRRAYASEEDYRDAVVMVAIYPYGSNPHLDVVWKNNRGTHTGKNNQYVGGDSGSSNPKYSIRIPLN